MTVRHPLNFVEQARIDFECLLKVARGILADDFDIPAGHLEHSNDVVVSLARVAPALASDVCLLVGLNQNLAAREAVTAGLAALKTIDPYLFAATPSVKRLALLQVAALGLEDYESCLHNCELDTVDQRRRSFHSLCRRLIAEGRGNEIPTDAEANAQPNPEPPGMMGRGGVRSSRVSFPRRRQPIDGKFAWEPPS